MGAVCAVHWPGLDSVSDWGPAPRPTRGFSQGGPWGTGVVERLCAGRGWTLSWTGGPPLGRPGVFPWRARGHGV
eukprot:6148582-Lingulodinium_polyedra.AAC.1